MSRCRPRALGRFVGAGLAVFLGFVSKVGAQALEIEEHRASDTLSIETFHSDRLVFHVLEASPNVIVFDFPTLEQQGRMFSRILALIERVGGNRERVLTDPELADLIKATGKHAATYAYGNDFRVGELVKFYNIASDGNVALNEDELLLRDFMLAKGIMTRKYEFYNMEPPEKVIISIPQSGGSRSSGQVVITEQIRRAILHHELSHGEFYTNGAYAEYCRRFWSGVMSDGQRAAFRKFLASKGYDPANDELIINETQAYLIHTPSQAIFSPVMVGLAAKDVAALVSKFWAGHPASRLFEKEHPRSH